MRFIALAWDHDPEYFMQVAALHIALIRHGALPLLGPSFLARLYREVARVPGGGVWAALENGRVRGFLAGCADLGAGLRAVVRCAGPALALRALPHLMSWPVLRRLPALALYPVRRPAPRVARPCRAELLAIAVDPASQGRGLGRGLVALFEEVLRARAGESTYGVATNAADPLSNAFYCRLGFEPAGLCPHHDLILQYYVKRLPEQRLVGADTATGSGSTS